MRKQRSRTNFPAWLWALFAVSFAFALGLGASAINAGWQLRAAGHRMAQLNRLEILDGKIRSAFGWADTVADHFTATGQGSIQEGNSLQDMAHASDLARRHWQELLAFAGEHTAEHNVAIRLGSEMSEALDRFQVATQLRLQGHKAASIAAYRATDLLIRNVYTGLDDLGDLSGQEQLKLSREVSARGRSVIRTAFAASSATVLLLAVFAALLWIDAHRRLEAETRYRSLFENASDPMLLLDAQGVMLDSNPAWRALTGAGQSNQSGSLRELCSPESSAALAAILEKDSVSSAELQLRNQSGEELVLEVSTTRIQRKRLGVRIELIARDITHRSKMDRLKAEFISLVSHELRTPLTSIRGALGLLASGRLGTLPEKGQNMLVIASENTDRLVRLVNDILDLEKLDSGVIQMQAVPTSAAALVKTAVNAMSGLALKARVELRADAGEMTLQADPDRMVQVFTNLISNAIKFSPAGGVVTLAARQVEDVAEFSVVDQGRGIPADMLEAVFERFRQVEEGDARKKGGTGLGLPICRKIVEQHGGLIWAESGQGKGSKFIVQLPLQAVQAAASS